MEHYKILGVDKNATMEEITKAYEKKISEFKNDINDERRAKAFIKVFDKAYEDIKFERAKLQENNTIVMGIDEFSGFDHLEDNFEGASSKIEDYNSRVKQKKKASSKTSSVKKKSSSKSTSAKGSKAKKEPDKSTTRRKSEVKAQREVSMISTLLQLPLKAVALVLIVVLSTILLLCKIISFASWLASRVIMAAAIGGASIHGYQIYIGHAIRYDIFILCAGAFIVALFLPSIVRIIPSMIGGVNNKLKEYVFN